MMRRAALIFLFMFSVVGVTYADESRTIEGRVVDENNRPVKDAAVDFFWRANGPATNQDGKPIDPATAEGNKLSPEGKSADS